MEKAAEATLDSAAIGEFIWLTNSIFERLMESQISNSAVKSNGTGHERTSMNMRKDAERVSQSLNEPIQVN